MYLQPHITGKLLTNRLVFKASIHDPRIFFISLVKSTAIKTHLVCAQKIGIIFMVDQYVTQKHQ